MQLIGKKYFSPIVFARKTNHKPKAHLLIASLFYMIYLMARRKMINHLR